MGICSSFLVRLWPMGWRILPVLWWWRVRLMYAHPRHLPPHWPSILQQAERAGVRDLEGCAAVPAGDERQAKPGESPVPNGKRALRKAQPRSRKQFLTRQIELLESPCAPAQSGAFISLPAGKAVDASASDAPGREAFFCPVSQGSKNFRGRSSTAYQSHT